MTNEVVKVTVITAFTVGCLGKLVSIIIKKKKSKKTKGYAVTVLIHRLY